MKTGLLALTVLTLCVGCGDLPETPKYHVTILSTDHPPLDQIDTAFGLSLSFLPGPNKNLREAFGDFMIDFVPGEWNNSGALNEYSIPCPTDSVNAGHRCGGYTDPDTKRITVIWNPGMCISETAIGHELGHLAVGIHDHVYSWDPYHFHYEYFRAGCETTAPYNYPGDRVDCVWNTMEMFIHNELASDYCEDQFSMEPK